MDIEFPYNDDDNPSFTFFNKMNQEKLLLQEIECYSKSNYKMLESALMTSS